MERTRVSAALFNRLLLSSEEVPQWHVQDDQPLHVAGTAGKRGCHGCKHLGTVSKTFIRALTPDQMFSIPSTEKEKLRFSDVSSWFWSVKIHLGQDVSKSTPYHTLKQRYTGRIH